MKRGPAAPVLVVAQDKNPRDFYLTISPRCLRIFRKYMILKKIKVVCFDRLLQVLILGELRVQDRDCASLVSRISDRAAEAWILRAQDT